MLTLGMAKKAPSKSKTIEQQLWSEAEMELPAGPLLDDPYRGPNAKLLALRVPESLYGALERTSRERNIPIPLLVRHCIYFQFFPSVMEFNLKQISSKVAGKKAELNMEKQGPILAEIRETLEKILEGFEAGERARALALDLETQLGELEEEYALLWQQSLDSMTEEVQTKGTEKGSAP